VDTVTWDSLTSAGKRKGTTRDERNDVRYANPHGYYRSGLTATWQPKLFASKASGFLLPVSKVVFQRAFRSNSSSE